MASARPERKRETLDVLGGARARSHARVAPISAPTTTVSIGTGIIQRRNPCPAVLAARSVHRARPKYWTAGPCSPRPAAARAPARPHHRPAAGLGTAVVAELNAHPRTRACFTRSASSITPVQAARTIVRHPLDRQPQDGGLDPSPHRPHLVGDDRPLPAYRRTASELGLGELTPLDEAIPQLRATGPNRTGQNGGTHGPSEDRSESEDRSAPRPTSPIPPVSPLSRATLKLVPAQGFEPR